MPPIVLAAVQGQTKIVGLLLEKGADIESADKDGRTPLMWAAHHGHVSVVKLLIGRGANLEAADNQFGMNALMSAVAQYQTPAVEALLNNGAKINARMKDRRTALMLAALIGHVDAVKLLLERGAEVNARDSGQYTALSLAKVHKKTDIVEILEKAGGIEGKNIEEKTVRKYQIE